MMNHFLSIGVLEQAQWFAAAVFIPLVCWQYCARSSLMCRWVALLSGYAVQIGFFLLLDDVGLNLNFLILVSSVAGYFWITTTVAMWPKRRRSQRPVAALPADSEVTAS